MRLILAMLLIWATAARAAGPQDGPDGATLIRAAKSVVQVISSGCPGEEGDRAGSGFVLGKGGLIVTDLHVIAGCASYQVKYPRIDELPATVAHVLMARDLALLKVDHPPAVPGLQLAATPPQVKEELDVIGFPLGLPSYDDASLHVTLATEVTPALRDGLDPQTLDQLKSVGSPTLDTQVVRVDGNLLPGDSGAPLIDYQGNVAGIGDGGLERGTVGIGWATRPQYVDQLLNSDEGPPSAASGIASVAFAATIPSAGKDDRTVKCGALSLTRRRGTRLATLIKTSDDPIKLGKLLQDLIGSLVEQFDDEHFAIWTEPRSGAGIAVPRGLKIEAGPEYCTVHTAVPTITYLITLKPLPLNASTPEWELAANRESWLAGHRALNLAEAPIIRPDRKYSTPRRFENGGIVDRFMKTGQGKDGKAVWIYFNDLAGRGVFSSILVVNRDAKAAPEDMTGPEKLAWTLGLLAVNLTALPPLPEATTQGQTSATSAAEPADVVLPGARDYPRIPCGEAGLIPLSQPRTLADLAGVAPLPADLQSLVQARVGIGTEQIEDRRFDLWAQPIRGAIVLLPHGLKPAADQTVCRIPSASASVSYAVRVVHVATPKETGNDQRAFLHDLALAAGISPTLDPRSRFHAMIPPNGHIAGVLINGTRANGDPALIYVVSLRRDSVLTLFAMTDLDAAPAGLSPADRAALAQGLAAIRFSTLLPPTGFLTVAQKTNPANPAAAQSASH
jgi:S1-C subfamily serine protease